MIDIQIDAKRDTEKEREQIERQWKEPQSLTRRNDTECARNGDGGHSHHYEGRR